MHPVLHSVKQWLVTWLQEYKGATAPAFLQDVGAALQNLSDPNAPARLCFTMTEKLWPLCIFFQEECTFYI